MTATTYDHLLARVRDLVATTEGVPVVGISGHGGAGKSTLADRLGADLGLTEDQVVTTDGETGTEDHPMPPVLIVEGIRLFSDRTRDQATTGPSSTSGTPSGSPRVTTTSAPNGRRSAPTWSSAPEG